MFFSFPLSRQKILLNRKKRGKEKKLPERVEKVMCPSFSFCSLCYYVALCTNKDLALLTRWSTLWSLQNKHTGKNFFPNQVSQCSYLDIYISQNLKLCKGDFAGKFQIILQAKGINFFIWKFRFIILIFLLVFAEFVKSTAFCTLLLLFQRVDMLELRFDAKITI